MYFRHEIADTLESLRKWLKEARSERNEARAWAAAWKRAAKSYRSSVAGAYHFGNYWADDARIIGQKLATLRAENARLHDALAQAAAGEVNAVKDAQDAKRELHEVRAHLIESRAAVIAEGNAEKSLRRKAQLYAARQTGKLYEARGRIAELEAVIADMLDHLTEVLWYPDNDPQVEALRAALRKARGEAQP